MIRKAIVEGKFYPDNKKELMDFLSSSFENGERKSRIILTPHAGYVYSGRTAAKSFSHLIDDFETVIVIGTAHTMYLKRCATLRDCVFSNCLGDVKTDDEVIDILLEDEGFENNPKAHLSEHSVEVQLPFLQFLKKDFKLVPIVSNSEDKSVLLSAAKKIADLMKKNKKIALVISSDLSHYPPYEIAYISDNAIGLSYDAAIANKNVDYFYLTKDLLSQKYRKLLDTVACGFSPMVVGLGVAYFMDCNEFEIMEYTNSGDVTEAREEVVGYLSGMFVKSNRKDFRLNLDEKEKQYLLALSKKSIENYLKTGNFLKIDYFQYPKLNLPAAVFVTLTIDKELRGCIGCLAPHMLLGDAVIDYSVRAAFEDPRFSPLTESELKKIDIEISILSPLKKINNTSEIKENVHGVFVKKGFLSGTYLPQVWENFSNKEDFLRSLFDEKSGIGFENINAPDTEIYIYTVEKI